MYTDLPLKNTKEDKLGRVIFARQIAYGLVNTFNNNSESIVIGINGSWGCGKSTLINFIISEVEKISRAGSQKNLVLRFNPWMFSGQKELQAIFFKELFVLLQKNKEEFKEAAEKVAEFLSHLQFIKYFHSGIGEAVQDYKSLLEGLTKEKDLNKLKEEIDNLLIELKIKLYITIDDIDRLTPKEIVDIFQLVKLNGNFANTIFLLAYDREIVSDALQNQFKKNGEKFIEKIVQVDYALPPISEKTIRNIFSESLRKLFLDEDILGSIDKNLEEISNEPFIYIFTSLRDIYRFNNSIKLRITSIYNELNLNDFFQLEALRIFSPDVYKFVYENKNKLIYQKPESLINRYSTNLVKSGTENTPLQFINSTQFNNIEKSILINLFHLNNINRFDSQEKLIYERKIADANYFDRYFSLQLESGDISEYLFEKFLFGKLFGERIKILEDIFEQNKLSKFLYEIEIKCAFLKEIDTRNLIYVTLLFGEQLDFKYDIFLFSDPNYSIIERFSGKIINHISDISQRQEIILKFLSNQEKPYSFFSLELIDGIIMAKNKLDKNELTNRYIWHGLFFYEKDKNQSFINQIEELQKEIVIALFNNELQVNRYNEDQLSNIIQLTNFLHPEYYSENFHKLILKDKDFLKYLWMCFKGSFMTGTRGIGFQLSEKQFYTGMEMEMVSNRIENMNLQELTKKEIKIVNLFKKVKEDGFKEGFYYNIDTLELVHNKFE